MALMGQWGSPKERGHLKDMGVDGRIMITIRIKETVWKNVNWIALAQDRDNLRVVVNSVMNLRDA